MSKLFGFLLLLFLMFSSALAIYIGFIGDFDPVKMATDLFNDNQRDEALNLIEFATENKLGNQELLTNLQKKYEYSTIDKINDIKSGAINGEIFNMYSGMGAIGADLCIFGDLRDLGKQAYNYFTGNKVDYVVTALSGIGVASSALTATGAGAAEGVPVHVGGSIFKSIVKYCSKIKRIIPESVLKLLVKGEKLGAEVYKKIWLIFKGSNFNLPATVTILGNVKNIKYLDHAVEISNKLGKGAVIFINKAGEAGLSTYGYFKKYKAQNLFISAFKSNPKRVLGITKFHGIIHSAKIFQKQGFMIPLIVVLTFLATLLALLPIWLPVGMFFISSGLITFKVTRFIKRPKDSKKITEGVEKTPIESTLMRLSPMQFLSGALVGGLITLILSSYYYRDYKKDFLQEIEHLKQLNITMANELEIKKLIELEKNKQGEIAVIKSTEGEMKTVIEPPSESSKEPLNPPADSTEKSEIHE